MCMARCQSGYLVQTLGGQNYLDLWSKLWLSIHVLLMSIKICGFVHTSDQHGQTNMPLVITPLPQLFNKLCDTPV